MTTVPFGLLPSAFAGDEHVRIDGVTRALLPPVPIQTQPQQWSPTNWSGFAENTVSAPWGGHWQGDFTASFAGDASPPHSAQLSTCPPGCTFHSDAHHTADMLFGRIVAFPADFVQQCNPAKTDEVLFWLDRQAAFEASSPRPGSPNSLMAPPLQPTRQDAELLRICMYCMDPAENLAS